MLVNFVLNKRIPRCNFQGLGPAPLCDSAFMKTMKLFTLAAAASCALGASAFADHQPGHPAKMPTTKASENRKTWDDQPMLLRTVGFPVVFMGRAGHSMIRSPQIVSETFSGERTFLNKRGFFTKREMDRPGARVASASSQSITNKRG